MSKILKMSKKIFIVASWLTVCLLAGCSGCGNSSSVNDPSGSGWMPSKDNGKGCSLQCYLSACGSLTGPQSGVPDSCSTLPPKGYELLRANANCEGYTTERSNC